MFTNKHHMYAADVMFVFLLTENFTVHIEISVKICYNINVNFRG